MDNKNKEVTENKKEELKSTCHQFRISRNQFRISSKEDYFVTSVILISSKIVLFLTSRSFLTSTF